MRRPEWRRGLVDLLLAGLLGVGVATGAVLWLQDAGEARAADRALDSDRLDTALEALRDDGVYVAPDGRLLVDSAGERAIERAVAANPVPVHVVVWAPDQQIGLDRLLVEDVLERELGDEDGFLFVWEGPQEGSVVALGPRGGYVEDFSTASDFVGDPETTLVDAVSSVTPDAFYDGGGGEDDYWGGLSGGSFLGLVLGSSIVGAVLLLSRLAALLVGRRRLLPGDWRLREVGRP